MNDDEQRQSHLLDLFLHPGWKIVQSELQEAHRILVESAFQVKDERELYRRKGEIQKLNEFLNFEQMTKMQIDEDA